MDNNILSDQNQYGFSVTVCSLPVGCELRAALTRLIRLFFIRRPPDFLASMKPGIGCNLVRVYDPYRLPSSPVRRWAAPWRHSQMAVNASVAEQLVGCATLGR